MKKIKILLSIGLLSLGIVGLNNIPTKASIVQTTTVSINRASHVCVWTPVSGMNGITIYKYDEFGRRHEYYRILFECSICGEMMYEDYPIYEARDVK